MATPETRERQRREATYATIVRSMVRQLRGQFISTLRELGVSVIEELQNGTRLQDVHRIAIVNYTTDDLDHLARGNNFSVDALGLAQECLNEIRTEFPAHVAVTVEQEYRIDMRQFTVLFSARGEEGRRQEVAGPPPIMRHVPFESGGQLIFPDGDAFTHEEVEQFMEMVKGLFIADLKSRMKYIGPPEKFTPRKRRVVVKKGKP